MSAKLLFVCSGNICRSPMAEAIARHRARDLGLDLRADSAGTLMLEGHPADPKAVTACAEIGVDLQSHLSKGLTAELSDWADRILVMEPEHARFIQHHFPACQDKVVYLGHLVGQMEIPDPIGRRQNTFRKNRDLIANGVDALLRRFVP